MNSSSHVPRSSDLWKNLYENVISESEFSLRPERIVDARNAILDRAEEILTHPSTDERRALSHALRTLQLLEQTAIREAKAA
jgi:hypothetical protein